MAQFKTEGTYLPDSFVIGETKARKITIKAEAGKLKAASVLGKITATGKYVLCAKDNGAATPVAISDGSQKANVILSEYVDASGASDVDAVAYIEGVFDQDKIVLGSGHTLGSVDDDLRDKGIVLVKLMG